MALQRSWMHQMKVIKLLWSFSWKRALKRNFSVMWDAVRPIPLKTRVGKSLASPLLFNSEFFRCVLTAASFLNLRMAALHWLWPRAWVMKPSWSASWKQAQKKMLKTMYDTVRPNLYKDSSRQKHSFTFSLQFCLFALCLDCRFISKP